MRPILWYASFLALVLAAIACTATLSSRGGPAREEGPHFDHATHLDKGVECVDCHGDATAEFKALPVLDTCMQCHEDLDADQPAEKHAKNFFDAEGKGKWVRAGKQSPEIIFAHQKHAETAKDCKACHAAVIESKFIPQAAFMDMATCQSCHKQYAPEKNDCATCHKEIREDRPPRSHALGWKREHGRQVRVGELEGMTGQCALCHKRSDCDDCHKAEAPQNHHTNLWRQHGHAAAASMDRTSCAACHSTDSCNECHDDARPRTHRGNWGEPFNRHCVSCHLPDTGFEDQGCAVCHRGAPSHASAPVRPANPVHAAATPATCRECHSTPQPHPDNGQSCLECHR